VGHGRPPEGHKLYIFGISKKIENFYGQILQTIDLPRHSNDMNIAVQKHHVWGNFGQDFGPF